MKNCSAILSLLLIIASGSAAQQYVPLQTRVNHPSATITSRAASAPNSREVQILGIGGLNDVANAQKAGGTLSLGTYITFNGSTAQPRHGLYVFFNERPANTGDTAVAARSYLFPEVGKRSFVIGYERFLNPNGWGDDQSLVLFTEASWSKNTISNTEASIFYSKNLTLGLRFALTAPIALTASPKRFGFSFQPYYQLVSIDSKDFALRDSLFRESSLPPTFHSIGFYTVVQIAELGIFANVKQVLNYSADVQNRDLKGGLIVVGALISTDFFRF